ncbi:hypothetical protein [Streptomyces roseus]|nr:hypothetical protein [Streptomyces roseus]
MTHYQPLAGLALADLADHQDQADDDLLHQVHDPETQTETGLISDITA